jgi:hypothetical protein
MIRYGIPSTWFLDRLVFSFTKSTLNSLILPHWIVSTRSISFIFVSTFYYFHLLVNSLTIQMKEWLRIRFITTVTLTDRWKIILHTRGSLLDTRDSFQSTAASICACTKLYSLLPCSRFTKQFVTFTPGCWRRVFAIADAPLVQDGPRTTGFPQMAQNLTLKR